MPDKVTFSQGTHSDIPQEKVAGRLLVCTDTSEVLLDVDSQTRITLVPELVTSISNSSTNTEYPTAKAVNDAIQAALYVDENDPIIPNNQGE